MRHSICVVEDYNVGDQMIVLDDLSLLVSHVLGDDPFSSEKQPIHELIIESDPPDLVIVDTDLPLNGNVRIGASQLMELMSRRSGWRKIPKLVLTSDSSSSIFQQTTKKNVCAAILKPYDPRRFIQEVFNCISKRLDAHIKEINRQHI